MFDGPRVDSSYDPMRKQGAIVLGNGGDNSNGSQGTFYEGVMTAGYPSDATDQQVQANIVAARYDVQRLSLTPASATDTPPGLQTFAPRSSQDVHRDVHEHHGVARGGREVEHLRAQQAVDLRRPGHHRHVGDVPTRSRPARA